MSGSYDPVVNPVMELAVALEGLGLQRVFALDENLFSLKGTTGGALKPIMLLNSRLRFAHHFDLSIDLLVYDVRHGTLGLVQCLTGKKKNDVEREVQVRVDQAAYIRHLLLNSPELGKRLPMTVELIFLVEDRKPKVDYVGQALGHVSSETQFFEVIGINLLLFSPTGAPFSRKALRRAFPWLLQATEAWYASRPAMGREFTAPRLTAVELENFRIRGSRQLELDEKQVHLIFGRNGSGKSSLVEALELVVTGGIERLSKGPDYVHVDYVQVIQSRGSREPVRVRIHRNGIRDRKGSAKGKEQFEVRSEGVANALENKLKASSFRLDQILMDQLTRVGDAKRAEIFLSSFFVAESTSSQAYEFARKSADLAMLQLPISLREVLTSGVKEGEDVEAGILRQLTWLGEDKQPLPKEFAEFFLPLPMATISTLSLLSPELAQLSATWREGPPRVAEAATLLDRIDENLKQLRKSVLATLETLNAARTGLRLVSGWQAKGRREGRDFVEDLNDWLRHSALVTLADQHCQLLEILSAANQGGSPSQGEAVWPFGHLPISPGELLSLRDQLATLIRERDDLLQRISTAASFTGLSSMSKPVTAALPSHKQREQMDIASRWLFSSAGESSQPLLLGQALGQAFAADRSVQVGDITLGTPDWEMPLFERLDRLISACQALEQPLPVGAKNFMALQEVREFCLKAQEAGAAVGQSFLRQLQAHATEDSSLLEALNELMALFTPVRWAYEDIVLELQMKEGKFEGLSFRIGEQVQAALSLNTAQLNLFTIALFLLCAIQVKNPLALLILDDPLQNMDELTVTTLARGIAKVSRIWPKPWQLLLLFHGQEDRDRFCHEVQLAVYELPWWNPSRGIEQKISGRQLYTSDLQTLSEVAVDLSSIPGSSLI